MAYLPLALTLFLLLSIVFQGYQRYRRIKAGLPPVAPPSPLLVRLRIAVLLGLAGAAGWIIVERLRALP